MEFVAGGKEGEGGREGKEREGQEVAFCLLLLYCPSIPCQRSRKATTKDIHPSIQAGLVGRELLLQMQSRLFVSRCVAWLGLGLRWLVGWRGRENDAFFCCCPVFSYELGVFIGCMDVVLRWWCGGSCCWENGGGGEGETGQEISLVYTTLRLGRKIVTLYLPYFIVISTMLFLAPCRGLDSE